MIEKDVVVFTEEENAVVDGLENILKGYVTAHSEFQIRNFILSELRFPGAVGKYHQAVRELDGRYWDIKNLIAQYKIAGIDIKMKEYEKSALQCKIAGTDDLTCDKDEIIRLNIQKIDIQIDALKDNMFKIKRKSRDKINESKVFLAVIDECMPNIPEEFKGEDGIPVKELSEKTYWADKQYIAQMLGNRPDETPFGQFIKFKTEEDNETESLPDSGPQLRVAGSDEQ